MATQNQDDVLQQILNEISGMKGEISGMKGEISSLRSEMHTGFDRLENTILDVRDEMRAENVTTRTLFNQAFTHISDQLSQEGEMDFLPKYPRTKR